MQPGERFLLDMFELESTDQGYRLFSPDDPAPVAEVTTGADRCQVCMLRSGLRFPCTSLAEAERTIAACRYLGL